MFDVLRAAPGSPPVTTGHLDGVVTLDLEEADPARREDRRVCLDERYRTMPGHLRHEIGHYYWYRLLRGSAWMDEFRELFGDERLPYDEALRDHYRCGPPVDWHLHHVSAYASAHPWEDWAETWAHYLHMLDTSATAAAVGIDTTRTELLHEPFTVAVLEPLADRAPEELFLTFLNAWIALTVALNELSRSMGHPDFYPFVLSSTAVRKLHFVHRVVEAFAGRSAP
ncbi:MAG: putative zinc-binding metallopeptidase [Burkholderiales bacterium]|nr:putative zinc-binding metallopeptidase [Burkholderiales bacterium]